MRRGHQRAERGPRQLARDVLAEVRHEGADGEGDSLFYVPVTTHVVSCVLTDTKFGFRVIVCKFFGSPFTYSIYCSLINFFYLLPYMS